MIQGSNQAKGSIFTLVVLQELSTRSYIGCPNDSKKIPDAIEGKEAVCPKCGNIVKPKVLQWALYLVGDSTDEIIASFPPSIMNRPTERMVIIAQGLLGENEEFLVYRWTLPSESSKAIAPTEQTLTPFFKPITTQSPSITTQSPSITQQSPSITQESPLVTKPLPGITQTPAPASVIEPDSRPAGGTLSNQGVITSNQPGIRSNEPSTTPNSPPSNNPLVCNQCGIGPFENQLKLESHKTTAHPVKKARKKKTMPDLTASTAPIPTASTVTPPTASTVTPPTASIPITLTASPEQATLSTTLPPGATLVPTDVKPSQTTEVQTPTPGPAAPVPAQEQARVVGGLSEGAQKYTKLCGLVKKPLAEFKLQFETNFPGQDMAKALELSHCTIVEDKVVFIGGS